MVEELCTRGIIWFWFDGGADDPRGDGPDVEPIVNKYQPSCLFYHNIDRADFRWEVQKASTVGYPAGPLFPAPCSHHKRIESQKDQIALLKVIPRKIRRYQLWQTAPCVVPTAATEWFRNPMTRIISIHWQRWWICTKNQWDTTCYVNHWTDPRLIPMGLEPAGDEQPVLKRDGKK